MRKTMTKRWLIGIPLLCLLLAAGCAKNDTTPSENESAATGSVTPTVEVTPEATATPIPTSTPTPTETPAPTPTIAYGSAEQMRRNRELHEIVNPKRELSQTGTAPALSEQDQLDVSHGIARMNPLKETESELPTGGAPQQDSGDNSLRSVTTVHFSGLKDKAVCEKINSRIDEIVSAMADPNYLPDVSGIYTIIKERGLPKVRVRVDAYTSNRTNGVQSVQIRGSWFWEEEGIFPDDDAVYRYQEESWPADDGVFESSSEFDYADDTNTTRKAEFTFYIFQTVGVTFNLATGEEMQLSDFFPEGVDYLGYLNEAITESLRTNSFWFDDQDYTENGDIHLPFTNAYQEGLEFSEFQDKNEYDGRSAFTGLTGGESFYLYENKVYFPQLSGHEIYVELPAAVPDPCFGKDIFEEAPEWRLASLGSMEMCDMDYSYAVRGPKMGTVRVPIDGKEQKIVVYKGSEEYPVWRHSYDEYPRTLEEIGGRFYTDEELLEFVKQWFLNEWPRVCEIRSKAGDDTLAGFAPKSAIVTRIEIFPEGFAYVHLEVAPNLKEQDDFAGTRYWAYAWMKDGKYIPGEELFDVSYEELLTELFANLRRSDRSEAMTGAQAAEAAKLLAPYIISPGQEHEPSDEWSWDLLTFPWWMIYSGEESEVNFPKDLRDHFPEALWNNLLQDWDTHEDLFLKDPYLYSRHLRMYEGYSFGK